MSTIEMDDWEIDAENMGSLNLVEEVPQQVVSVTEVTSELSVVPESESEPVSLLYEHDPDFYYTVLFRRINHLLEKQRKRQYSGPYIATISLKNTNMREPEIVKMVLEKRGFLTDGVLRWNRAVTKKYTMEEIMDYRNWNIKKNKHGDIGVAKKSFDPRLTAYYM